MSLRRRSIIREWAKKRRQTEPVHDIQEEPSASDHRLVTARASRFAIDFYDRRERDRFSSASRARIRSSATARAWASVSAR
jgi:hypothetical protein